MNDLLIYTYATGKYTCYSDLWQYCIEHEYPEYQYLVFTSENKIPYYGAIMRFLVDPDIESRYYYITDIDMMIVREETTIVDFHKNDLTGCFSNSSRNLNDRKGSERVTGLHFCTPEWYIKTKEAREKYRKLLYDGKVGEGFIDDEVILGNIIIESGLQFPTNKPKVCRYHGLHCGNIRGLSKISRSERKNKFNINLERALRWREIVSTKTYRNILSVIKKSDQFIVWQLNEIERFCMQKCNERHNK
jgi:hypothetical protein